MFAALPTLALAFFLLNPASAAILNTTPYTNTSTMAPYNNMTMASTTPSTSATASITPTTPTTSVSLTPTVVLSTEIATGADGVATSTLVVAITAPAGAGATKVTSTSKVATTTGPTPGLQTGGARGRGVEAAALGVVGLAGWMVIWG